MLIAICPDGCVGERRQGFSEGRDVFFYTPSLTLWHLWERQQPIQLKVSFIGMTIVIKYCPSIS